MFFIVYIVTTLNCRSAGIVTVSIRVGSVSKYDTLLDVAGNKSRVFQVSDYSNLNSITAGLVRVIEESASTGLEGERFSDWLVFTRQLYNSVQSLTLHCGFCSFVVSQQKLNKTLFILRYHAGSLWREKFRAWKQNNLASSLTKLTFKKFS